MPTPETWRELRQLTVLAIPIALTSVGQSLMGWTDTAVTGWGSPSLQAASGLGNVLFFAVAVVGMGVMLGLDPLISQAVGAGESTRARQLLWQGVWLALGVGTLLCIPLTAMAWAVGAWGSNREVAAMARTFILWRLPSVPLLLLFVAVRAYLQGLGRPRVLVAATVLANVGNLFATVLLTFGGASWPRWTGPLRQVPALGIGGTAAASSCAMLLQLLLTLWVLRREGGSGAVSSDVRRLRRADISKALALGAPIGAHMAMETGVFAVAGVLAERLGVTSLAAHQIALSYGSLTFCIAIGIGAAGSVRVGWAIGAGDTHAARRAGWVAFAAGGGFMAVASSAFILFPRVLAGLMSRDPQVIEIAAALFVVLAFFQVADGLQGVGAGVLRGAGDTRFTLWANLVAHYLVALPILLVLGMVLHWGVVGVWWGLSAGLVLVALALCGRFHHLTRHAIRRV